MTLYILDATKGRETSGKIVAEIYRDEPPCGNDYELAERVTKLNLCYHAERAGVAASDEYVHLWQAAGYPRAATCETIDANRAHYTRRG